MGFFKRILGDRPKIEGELGFFGLADWWLDTFSEEERKYIEASYKPLGSSPGARPLTQGRMTYSSGSATKLLTGLATWFQDSNSRQLARRILAKAEELASEADILDLHFTYQGMIETYYRDRDGDPAALNLAVEACQKQIALAPRAARAFRAEYKGSPRPAHVGYKQLAIIREKEGNYVEAVRLSQEAKEQGWAGDWEARITRCEKKALRR